jgi:ubiquinone/menaquinone biosynthesis C-methylase UbiE
MAATGGQIVTDKRELREEWDKIAPRYGSDFWDRVEERLYLTRWRRQLLARASGRVLEIATGTGINLPYYPKSCEIIATDLSPRMLARARQCAENLGRKVGFCTMDAEALDFPDDSFDTVVDCNSLCVFPNPIAALREMGRVCRIDGRILLLEHGRSHHKWVARLQDWDVEARVLYGCDWNRSYEDLIREAGLPIVSAERRLLGAFYLIEAKPPGAQRAPPNPEKQTP